MKAEWFNLKREDHFNKFYPIVKDWWEGKGWSAVHPEILPINGIIIKDDDYICAGWLYCTDSLLGMISGIITDNKSKGKKKKEAIELLIKTLEELSEKLGIKLVYIPMETKSICRILEKDHKQGGIVKEFLKENE